MWTSAVSAGRNRALRKRARRRCASSSSDHAAGVMPRAGVRRLRDCPGRRRARPSRALLALGVRLRRFGGRPRRPRLALLLGGLGTRRPRARLLAGQRAGRPPCAARRASRPRCTGVSGSVRNVTPLGRREVADTQHVAELQLADVGPDLLGHVAGQTLDLDLAQVVLDHAAGLDARRPRRSRGSRPTS